MGLLAIATSFFIFCYLHQTCRCQFYDSYIYFPGELPTPTPKKTTTTTTAKPDDTTLSLEELIAQEVAAQKELAAEADRICAQKYSGPKPQYDANLSKSENKCVEWRHLLAGLAFQIKNDADCKKARKAAGFFEISVVGGQLTEPGEFPHMAAIGWPSKEGGFVFKCGGSLISEKHVMTAGHCLVSSRDTTLTSAEPTIVRLGDQNILDKEIDGLVPQEYKIARVIRHPEYNSPKKYNDIALLELEKEVSMDIHVRPACLWNKPRFDFTIATVTGWGVTQVGNLRSSPELLKAPVDLIDSNQCDELLLRHRNRHWQGLVDHQVCAGDLKGGADTCQGDSGGPLQVREKNEMLYYILGVTSFGFQCGSPNTPGVYTRVSEFVPWIESVVWP